MLSARSILLPIGFAIGVASSPYCNAQAKLDHALTEVKQVGIARQNQINMLYQAAILEYGDIQHTTKHLASYAQNAATPRIEKHDAHYVSSHLFWQHGQLTMALEAIDHALAIDSTQSEALLLKAKLLDAKGDTETAVHWYKKALATSNKPNTKEFITLRLTILDSATNSQALLNLAQTRDDTFKRRAAIVLALQSRTDEAFGLYSSENTNSNYEDAIRMADWAIKTKHHKEAKNYAWRAWQLAKIDYNAHYALALYTEACRDSQALAACTEQLANHPKNDTLRDLHIDLLIEQSRYADAIALLSTANSQLNLPQRKRLVQLFLLTNQSEKLEQEYTRLIANEPHNPLWYESLASHYLSNGKSDLALKVWQQLQSNNLQQPTTIISAAEAMSQMGFSEHAKRMLEAAIPHTTHPLPLYLTMFDIELNAGREKAAAKILQRAQRELTLGTADKTEIADAWERAGNAAEALRIYEELNKQTEGLSYDQKMRLAWLYSVNQNKHKALELWRALWLQMQNPARRGLAEAQLLQIAAELNLLADIVVEIEDKLASGKAKANEIDLVVKIYIQVGDQLSAVEVIEEFAQNNQMAEVEKQQQLGQVYMLLEDYQAYDKTLEKLVKLDPEHKQLHLRNRILTLVNRDLNSQRAVRLEKLEGLLQALKQSTVEGLVDDEFEAGIMNMAGFHPQAIASYRRSLAKHPDKPDNLLLLSDLMQKAGGTEQAIALLQYFAEQATDDGAFVIAVDGLINLAGTDDFGKKLSKNSEQVFSWLQRLILQRIATTGDRIYLYHLLAEIASDAQDYEKQFIALETSLAIAGHRRSNTLREIVTLATEDVSQITNKKRIGDLQRKQIYGHRLVALKQSLPPEIYIGLGNTLLANGDQVAADKALDMISDITGQIDLNKTKADMYLKAGYIDKALEFFNRALVTNKTDLDLLIKTAMLREQTQRDDIANGGYWRALQQIFSQQKAKQNTDIQDIDELWELSASRELKAHYENLVQGFLITWPKEKFASDVLIAETLSLIENEISELSSSIPAEPRLLDYPRLSFISAFARRIAEAGNYVELARKIEQRLYPLFSNDENYREAIHLFYQQWNRQIFAEYLNPNLLSSSPNNSPSDNRLAWARQQAEYNGTYARELALLRISGQNQGIFALLNRLLDYGAYEEAFRTAMQALPEAKFQPFITSIMAEPDIHEEGLFNMLVANAKFYLEVEKKGGAINLIPREQLFARIKHFSIHDYEEYAEEAADNLWLILDRQFSVSNKLTFIANMVNQGEAGISTEKCIALMQALLSEPLNQAQQRKWLAIAQKILASIDYKDSFASTVAIKFALYFDTHKENQTLLVSIARIAEQNLGLDEALSKTVAASFRQTPGKTLTQTLELKKKLGEKQYILDEVLANQLIDAQRAHLENAGKKPSDSLKNILYLLRLETERANVNMAQQTALIKSLIQRYPESVALPLRYLELLMIQQKWPLFEKTLNAHLSANPENLFIRASLYQYYLSRQKLREAEDIALAGPLDLRLRQTEEQLEAMANKEASSEHLNWAGFYLRNYSGQFDNAIERKQRQAIAALVSATQKKSEKKIQTHLRNVWRTILGEINAPEEEPWRTIPYTTVTKWRLNDTQTTLAVTAEDPSMLLSETAATQTVLEEILKYNFGKQEIKKYLSALPPEQRQYLFSFYQMLAKAELATSNKQKEAQVLESKLSRKTLSSQEFFYYLALLEAGELTLSGEALKNFEHWVTNLNTQNPDMLLAAARVLALSGSDMSSELYLVVASAITQNYGYFENDFGMVKTPSALTLLKEVAKYLPPDNARAWLSQLATMLSGTYANEQQWPLFCSFLLEASETIFGAKQAKIQTESILAHVPLPYGVKLPRTLINSDTNNVYQLPLTLNLLRLNITEGKYKQALLQLKQLLQQPLHKDTSHTVVNSEQDMFAAATSLGLPYTLYENANEAVNLQDALVLYSAKLFPENNKPWLKHLQIQLNLWLEQGVLDTAHFQQLQQLVR